MKIVKKAKRLIFQNYKHRKEKKIIFEKGRSWSKNDNHKFYNSTVWKNFRQVVLNNPFIENNIEVPAGCCVRCYIDKDEIVEATTVDHTKQISCGGAKLNRNNVQPLCTSCHNRKSAKERHKKN